MAKSMAASAKDWCVGRASVTKVQHEQGLCGDGTVQ